MRACSPKASLACLRAVLALGLREEPFYVVCEDCSGGCSLWQKGDGAVLRKHWEASRPHPKPQFVIPIVGSPKTSCAVVPMRKWHTDADADAVRWRDASMRHRGVGYHVLCKLQAPRGRAGSSRLLTPAGLTVPLLTSLNPFSRSTPTTHTACRLCRKTGILPFWSP